MYDIEIKEEEWEFLNNNNNNKNSKIMSERKSRNVFVIGYVAIMVTLFMMSSCGTSSQCYNVGTGKPMTQGCGGSWYGGQQYEKDNNKYISFINYVLWSK